MPNRPPIGRPLAYMAARLDPKPGAIQTADELHQDYVTWCGEQRLTALKAGAFREELVALARQTGIGLAQDTGDTILLDTSLRPGGRKRGSKGSF